MAHKLYYSIDGYYDSTVVAAGSFDQSDNSFTVTDGSQVTNEANINSNSISDAAISSFGTNDVIRVDFGVTKTIDFIANYHSVADTNDLYFYSEFTEATNRYWVLRSQDGTFDGMHEVIMGTALDIGQPEIGNTENEKYNTVYNQAYNGTQYSNKIDIPYTEWTIKLPIIDTTLKSALDTFQATVQNKFKFIYYDGNTNHYVRLVAPITYVLLAPLVYTVTIKLKESFE